MEEDAVLTTQEACDYLGISRPTYQYYLRLGKIRGTKTKKGWKILKNELDEFLKLNMEGDGILTTQEACDYLGISRPTYQCYLRRGRIKGTKTKKGWKVLRNELDEFLRVENKKW